MNLEMHEATQSETLNGFTFQHCVKAFFHTLFQSQVVCFLSCCIFTSNLTSWWESTYNVMYLCVLTANPIGVTLVFFYDLYCVFCISYCFFDILWFFLENSHVTLHIACCIWKDTLMVDIGQYLQFICWIWCHLNPMCVHAMYFKILILIGIRFG